MRSDAIWNADGYWEAPSIPSKPTNNIKIDITHCDIIINELGYIDLRLKGSIIKRLTFTEFLRYKKYVISIERKDIDYV